MCNPDTEDASSRISPQEGNSNPTTTGRGNTVADLSPHPKGRVGIYLGETSRSLHERATEHMKDAMDISCKCHVVKHWISDHYELENPQPFRFKVLRTFQDCLSRQLSEVVNIWQSQDRLLNSKNDYLTNCISRITVEDQNIESHPRGRNPTLPGGWKPTKF